MTLYLAGRPTAAGPEGTTSCRLIAAEHLPGAPAPRRALLKHASRTLIKQGRPAVMALWGLGRPLRSEARLKHLAPSRAAAAGYRWNSPARSGW